MTLNRVVVDLAHQDAYTGRPAPSVAVVALSAEELDARAAETDAATAEAAASRKAEARAEIDRRAELARLAWITPGSGQAAVYLAKAEEAQRLAGDGDPDPQDYPLLAASIGNEGETLGEVAAVVLATRAGWLQVAAAIEAIRLGAKAAIDALEDPPAAEAVAAILDGLEWPAP